MITKKFGAEMANKIMPTSVKKYTWNIHLPPSCHKREDISLSASVIICCMLAPFSLTDFKSGVIIGARSAGASKTKTGKYFDVKGKLKR